MTDRTLTLYRAIQGALAGVTSAPQIQALPPLAQLVAVAKGMIDPADLRIGGDLRPEEARAIVTMVTADTFLSQVTTETMRRSQKDIRVLDLQPRQLKRVAQGSEPEATDLAEPDEQGAILTALPAQLFATVPLDTLRDNADDPRLVDLIRDMIGTTFQNDITDLGCNGTKDDNSNGFLTLNKGWVQVAADAADTPKLTITPGAQAAASLATGVVASNNALTWTARQGGSTGNNIAVTLQDPAGNNQALSVTVSLTLVGAHVLVSLATGVAGAITSTAAQVKAAIEANADADALLAVTHTGASTGAGVVAAVAKQYLAGGQSIGWIDTLAAIRAAADKRYGPLSVFIMSPDDADAYDLEVGKHVTGAAVLATDTGHSFLRQPVVPCRYLPSGTVLYTPMKNLVLGMSVLMRRDAEYHPRRRALEITYDLAFDYEIAVKKALVLARTA